MNVNNSPNTNAADLYKSDLQRTSDVQQTQQTARAATAAAGAGTVTGANDDVHLSELVRTLRSLASDSPERQARIEQLARAAANGSYKVDPQATADALINDASSAKSVSA